jgi:hypothetical protein
MNVGETGYLNVFVRDASGNTLQNRIVTFASSDPTIVEVESPGVVTAKQPGFVWITATSEGKTGRTMVDVRPYLPCNGTEAFCVSPATYELVSVDGAPLPVYSPWSNGDWDYDEDAGTWQLISWTISLYADGVFTQATVERARSGATISDKSSGHYVRKSDSIEFSAKGMPTGSARVVGNSFIFQWTGGPAFVFERLQPQQ